MIEKSSERVEIHSSFSIAPSIPLVENLSAPFDNLSPISERVNDSTRKFPAKQTPPAQTLPTSILPILKLSPISERVKPQTENTLIATNPPEQNNS